MKTLINTLLLSLCFVGILLSCKRSDPPPAPPTKHADTLVLCVGGLGSDRTRHMAEELELDCSRAIVIQVAGWDAYKVDLRPLIAAYPTPHRVYLFHSYANWWLATPLPDADYVAALEPVSPGGSAGSWWGDLPFPAYAHRFDVYWRTITIGPRVARIPGTTPILVPGGHNDVPADASVIDRTVRIVNAL